MVPSGSAASTAFTPIEVPPPGRLSITTGCPSCEVRWRRDQPRDHVVRRARRERCDDLDRPLGLRRRRAGRSQHERRRPEPDHHGFTPATAVRSSTGYSPLMPAALMIGHHFSISAFCFAPSAAAVCCSRGKMSWPMSFSRCLTVASSSVSTIAALSLATIVGRRALGHPHAVPERGVKARHAEFVERRHVGRRPPALVRQHRVGLDLPVADRVQVGRSLPEREVDVARRAGPAAAARRRDRPRVWNFVPVCFWNAAAAMSAGPADADLARGRLAVVRLQPGDEFLEVVRRQRLLRR